MVKNIKILILMLSLGLFYSCGVSKKLYVTDGTEFTAQKIFPKFNWDVTPQYFMFGDGTRLLTDDEVETIAAKTDFICIEKNHAFRKLKFAEVGAKEEIARFKAVKPDIKALFYFNSAYAWPFTSYNQNFTRRKINKHPELKKFLIKNKKTGELEKRHTTFYFDVLNPEFRDWWVKTVVQGVTDTGADGVFIDQMHAFVWLRSPKKKEVERSMGEMMMSLKEALGPDKIVLGNNASDVEEVIPYVDAAMFEHYHKKTLSKERLLRDWKYMLANAKAGKMSIFRVGLEIGAEEETKGLDKAAKDAYLQKKSEEELEFFQACFLIGAQPYSYFQYGWGWRLDTGPLVEYPELYKGLGSPVGAYSRVKKGKWEFTREFEHAKVWVDTENRTSKITWL